MEQPPRCGLVRSRATFRMHQLADMACNLLHQAIARPAPDDESDDEADEAHQR
jgi:hypothetical protein